MIQGLHSSLAKLTAQFSVSLQWVPADVGLTGNEKADRLAKIGSQAPQTQNLVTYREAKTLLHSRYNGVWKKDNGGYQELLYSILGCVLPLQEVALRQSPPSFSVLCYPHPYRCLLPHNVISPTTFWSSGWSYTLCLPLCASNSPSIIFHSGDVSSPFPFRIVYVLDYVCHSGSLPNGGVTNSIFQLDIKHSPFHSSLACF